MIILTELWSEKRTKGLFIDFFALGLFVAAVSRVEWMDLSKAGQWKENPEICLTRHNPSALYLYLYLSDKTQPVCFEFV